MFSVSDRTWHWLVHWFLTDWLICSLHRCCWLIRCLAGWLTNSERLSLSLSLPPPPHTHTHTQTPLSVSLCLSLSYLPVCVRPCLYFPAFPMSARYAWHIQLADSHDQGLLHQNGLCSRCQLNGFRRARNYPSVDRRLRWTRCEASATRAGDPGSNSAFLVGLLGTGIVGSVLGSLSCLMQHRVSDPPLTSGREDFPLWVNIVSDPILPKLFRMRVYTEV